MVSSIVEMYMEMKKQYSNANTSRLEKQIDMMVYHLYNLNYKEAKIIDQELSEEELKRINKIYNNKTCN